MASLTSTTTERGESFNLGPFHAHGAPPFPINRLRVLKDDDGKLL